MTFRVETTAAAEQDFRAKAFVILRALRGSSFGTAPPPCAPRDQPPERHAKAYVNDGVGPVDHDSDLPVSKSCQAPVLTIFPVSHCTACENKNGKVVGVPLVNLI
jgi:hypothetical protein